MTASASVLEAGRALIDALKAYGFPVSGGAKATLTDGGSNEAYALNEAAISFAALLAQPAEQDAREAVARIVDPLSWEFYDRHASDPRMMAEIKHEVSRSFGMADRILALTQAAPDGWRPVPVEPTPEMVEAGYQPWLNRGNRKGPSVVRGVYLAMLSASPAPPAQGEGG